MRTRSQNTVVTTPASSVATLKTLGSSDPSYNNVQQGSIAGIVYNPAYNLSGYPGVVGRSESITDQTPGFDSWNPVTHTKDVWASPLTSIRLVGQSTEYLNRVCEATSDVTAGTGTLAGMRTGDSAWPSLSSTATLLANATAQMQFGVQTASTSLPVFLAELREFADAFKNVEGPLMNHVALANDVDLGGTVLRRTISRSKPASTVGEVVRHLMQVDLGWKFGVRPFLNDLTALHQMNKHLRTQRDRIDGGQAYLITRGCATAAGTDSYSLNPIGRDHYYSVNTLYTRTVRTWAQFKFDLTDVPRVPDWKLLLDAYGFDEPTSALWELLPFSWLIDYFVDIGSCLNGASGQLIELPYEILQDGYSVKEVADGVATLYICGGSNMVKRRSVTGVKPITGKMTRTRYSRVAGKVPYGTPTLPTLQLPNLARAWTVFEVAALRSQ